MLVSPAQVVVVFHLEVRRSVCGLGKGQNQLVASLDPSAVQLLGLRVDEGSVDPNFQLGQPAMTDTFEDPYAQ